jgi:Flp pilus assembly protein TadG
MRKNLSRVLRRFRRDERGLVAFLFAFMLPAVMGLITVGIDYSMASRDRVLLQSAIDGAALAAARSPALTDPQIAALINAQISANYSQQVQRTPTVSYARGDGVVAVTASDQVPRLMPLLLVPDGSNVAINASSEVRWGVKNVEIALVLDNTGSMSSSNKMTELKRALCGQPDCASTTPSSGFVRIIKDVAIRDNQFRVGIVPFDTVVRVPLNMQLEVNAAAMSPATFPAPAGAGYCTHASVPNDALRYSWFRFAPRDKDTNASWLNATGVNVGTGCGTGRATPATWQGCVWDRDMALNLDTSDAMPTIPVVADLHPAVNCRTTALARIKPLDDIRTSSAALIEAIRVMTPSGNTNIKIGVAWGMALLSSAEPFTEAAVASSDISKFMILLTDGDNTEAKDSSNLDARTLAACTAAKARGITVYAIRVINGNATLLANCATSASHYKSVSNAAELTPVFEKIAREIGALRISH